MKAGEGDGLTGGDGQAAKATQPRKEDPAAMMGSVVEQVSGGLLKLGYPRGRDQK